MWINGLKRHLNVLYLSTRKTEFVKKNTSVPSWKERQKLRFLVEELLKIYFVEKYYMGNGHYRVSNFEILHALPQI